MKVLTLLTYYHPHWTGLTNHAVSLAEGLAARGHQVTVLATRHSPQLPRREWRNGVRIERVQPVARFSRGMLAPAFPYRAARLIAQSDVVQIHTPLPEALLVAALCRALGRPLIMTHHGDVVMPGRPLDQLVQSAAFHLLLSAARQAEVVTSYSRDYAEHSPLLSRVADKLAYIHPPVRIPPPSAVAANALRRELGLGDRLVIGFAGRWVQEKGFDVLLLALPLIRAAEPRVHLVFAGDRDVQYEDFYAQCVRSIESARPNITLLDLILDRQQLADFYAMCDLFVLPSRTDNMALAAIEALLCGTPLVVTDIPGTRMIVRETGAGLLAPPGNPAALADTILAALHDLGALQPDRERVNALFEPERCVIRNEGLMRSVTMARAWARAGQAPLGAAPDSDQRSSRPDSLTAVSASNGATRSREPASPADGLGRWRSLTSRDHAILDMLLGNEADMAFRRRARRLLDYLELRDGDRVLDCGCGMGFYLLAMSRLRHTRLTGLDTDLARLRQGQAEAVPATLIQGQVERLPFPEATFDRVLLTEVLEHVPDDRIALRELFRVLRPGGILAISVPHARYPFWWDPINWTWTALGGQPIRSGPLVGIWTGHQRLYLPDQLDRVVSEAGFEVETLEESTHYSVPFQHFLVYGIGKPLLERGLLPARVRNAADRMRRADRAGSRIDPIALAVAAFRFVDRFNEHPGAASKSTYMNVLLMARKPM